MEWFLRVDCCLRHYVIETLAKKQESESDDCSVV